MSNNRLFEITLRIHKTEAMNLHPRFAGAQIVVYAIAPSEESALSAARGQLITEGHELVNEPPGVRELNPKDWARHVNESWSGLRGQLPSQEDVIASMANPRIFFGSFYPFE